jgi:hypothetical protein
VLVLSACARENVRVGARVSVNHMLKRLHVQGGGGLGVNLMNSAHRTSGTAHAASVSGTA